MASSRLLSHGTWRGEDDGLAGKLSAASPIDSTGLCGLPSLDPVTAIAEGVGVICTAAALAGTAGVIAAEVDVPAGACAVGSGAVIAGIDIYEAF